MPDAPAEAEPAGTESAEIAAAESNIPPDNFETMATLLMELQSQGYPPKEITGELPEGSFRSFPLMRSFQDWPLTLRLDCLVSVSSRLPMLAPSCNSQPTRSCEYSSPLASSPLLVYCFHVE